MRRPHSEMRRRVAFFSKADRDEVLGLENIKSKHQPFFLSFFLSSTFFFLSNMPHLLQSENVNNVFSDGCILVGADDFDFSSVFVCVEKRGC